MCQLRQLCHAFTTICGVTNPAQLLLNQLREWQRFPPTQPGRRPATVQQVRNPEGDGFLAHRIAVQQLEAIDQLLGEMGDAGADVSVYRRYFPEWVKAVFAYPHGWGVAAASVELNASGILDHLQNLAEAMRLYVPVLQPTGLESIRDYAQQVKDALQEDTSIPQQLRIHAHEVIEHLLWCVDRYNLVGDFILSEALERLAATVVRVASNSDEEHRGTWRTFFTTTFVWPFTVNMIAAIPSQALALLALGPGH